MGTPSLLARSLTYGLLGWAMDRAFTTATNSRRSGRLRLAPARVVLFPVYALLLPLHEPLHERLRRAPTGVRVILYAVGSVTVEYASGRLLRSIFGSAPWDYGGARWSVHGLTRLDYLPLWAAAGLLLERVHDRLTSGGLPDGSLSD